MLAETLFGGVGALVVLVLVLGSFLALTPLARHRGRRSPDTELTEVLGCKAWVERPWSRWREVGGWHVASGPPKPTELAVAAGSAFLIRTERSVVPADVQRLARRGVGLRRPEGFGDLAGPPRSPMTNDTPKRHAPGESPRRDAVEEALREDLRVTPGKNYTKFLGRLARLFWAVFALPDAPRARPYRRGAGRRCRPSPARPAVRRRRG